MSDSAGSWSAMCCGNATTEVRDCRKTCASQQRFMLWVAGSARAAAPFAHYILRTTSGSRAPGPSTPHLPHKLRQIGAIVAAGKRATDHKLEHRLRLRLCLLPAVTIAESGSEAVSLLRANSPDTFQLVLTVGRSSYRATRTWPLAVVAFAASTYRALQNVAEGSLSHHAAAQILPLCASRHCKEYVASLNMPPFGRLHNCKFGVRKDVTAHCCRT